MKKARGREGVGRGRGLGLGGLCKRPPGSRWEGETMREEELEGSGGLVKGAQGGWSAHRIPHKGSRSHYCSHLGGFGRGGGGSGHRRNETGAIPWLSWAG